MSEALDPRSTTATGSWEQLRQLTQARVGLGRAGDSLPTRAVGELRAAHAAARDAVHVDLDTAALVDALREAGLGEVPVVTSRAADRATYLRRPDLGRQLHPDVHLDAQPARIGILLADGLSPQAVATHGVALVRRLVDVLGEESSVATPVLATQARVALGDQVGEQLGVETMLVVIGERPGLSAVNSLGIYITHQPRPGRHDAERNCISNVRPPRGVGYQQAAVTTLRLVRRMRELGRSGVDVKDVAEPAPLTNRPAPEVQANSSL